MMITTWPISVNLAQEEGVTGVGFPELPLMLQPFKNRSARGVPAAIAPIFNKSRRVRFRKVIKAPSYLDAIAGYRGLRDSRHLFARAAPRSRLVAIKNWECPFFQRLTAIF